MDVETVLPEIERIDECPLRGGVAAAWRTAATENGLEIAELPAVPWFPRHSANSGWRQTRRSSSTTSVTWPPAGSGPPSRYTHGG